MAFLPSFEKYQRYLEKIISLNLATFLDYFLGRKNNGNKPIEKVEELESYDISENIYKIEI